jgi:hypothetical protein
LNDAKAESAEAARVRQLYDLGCAFAAKTELGELIPFIIKRCREALNAEAASLLLLNPEGTELYSPYVSDDDASGFPEREPVERLDPEGFRERT